MNHIYRSIWSEALATWIAVSEISKAKGKASTVRKKALATTALLLCSSSGWALPTGEQVVTGQVNVATPNAGQMQINQGSQQAIVNWQGFSINPTESVNIQQPNANATLLNRVVGIDASVIQGQLNANGQVYLVNPNGVLFSKTAQVDVGGLIATTHNISNADFLNGNLHFTQNSANGAVSNQGYIKTPEGGVVALIGTQVSNEGFIETPKGSTILAAGKTVDLDFKGDGLVEVKVPEAALNAQVENKGAILADGGHVVLTAKAAGQLTDTVLNSEGLIQAKSLTERNGEIVLEGGSNGVTQVSGTLDVSGQSSGKINVTGKDVNINVGANLTAQTLSNGKAGTIKVLGDMNNGVVNVAGKLDASAPIVGDGGFIETSAAKVKIADSTQITTKAANGKSGVWLIDPLVDFTIAASGGDITGQALSNALNPTLGGGDVTIFSSAGTVNTTTGLGDVNVNDVVNWSANLLTLNAEHNININANMNASGSAQLALKYGQTSTNGINSDGSSAGDYFINNGAKVFLPAGANFSTQKGSDLANLKNYTVITSLGAEGSTTTTDLQGMNGGNRTEKYALGDDIDASSTIAWNNGEGFEPIGGDGVLPFYGSFAGLGHSIKGLYIYRPNSNDVGLFGSMANNPYEINNLSLLNVNITGKDSVGGLIGYTEVINIIDSSVSNVYVTGQVTGNAEVGGLLGRNTILIDHAYSNADVTGYVSVGGLVGYNYNHGISPVPTIKNSYATGKVTGLASVANTNLLYQEGIGGLAGYNSANIETSYATGNVDGYISGGLVGFNNFGSIKNAYATGNVTATYKAGGLVGWNEGDITNTYATGVVNKSASFFGGLVGYYNNGKINNSFWDRETTGIDDTTGLVGKTTAELMTQSTYLLPPSPDGTVNAWDFNNIWWMSDTNTRPFLQMEHSTNITNAHQLQLMARNPSANYTLANNIDLTNELANPSSMWGTATTTVNTGITTGFLPIDAFIGNFDGLGHTITGLTINRPNATGNIGLFADAGYSNGVSSIRNIGLIGASITGNNIVGGLVGNNYGSVNNAYTTGSVNGSANVGGLVGRNTYSTANIENSYSIASVNGDIDSIGGLVGTNYGGKITNSYATGKVMGSASSVAVGGLTGTNWGTISNSYASGEVTGKDVVGGLVGYNDGTPPVGSDSISNAYATGKVTGTNMVGGLVGSNKTSISNTYSTGNVGGTTKFGALAGENPGIINNSFWDTTNNPSLGGVGFGNNAGITGKTTADLMQLATFTSATWDIRRTGGNDTIWRLYEGHTRPLLTSFMTPKTLTDALDESVPYDGQPHTAATTSIVDPLLLGAAVKDVINAGFYNGYYSTQEGFDLTGGNLTIKQAAINIIGLSGSRSYDGTTAFDSSILIAKDNGSVVDKNEIGLSGVGYVSSANVGSYTSFTSSSTLTLSNPNYTLTGGSVLAEIIKAALNITANDASKIYDGLAYTGGNGVTYTGFVNNETSSVLTGTLVYGGNSQNAVNAGSYLITPSGLNSDNYSITYSDGTLTVNPAALSITANDDGKTQDGSAYIGGNSVTYSGFVNNETSTVLSGDLSYGGSSQGAISAGDYTITPQGLNSNNYQIAYKDGILTIKPEIGSVVNPPPPPPVPPEPETSSSPVTEVGNDFSDIPAPIQNSSVQPIQPELSVKNSAGQVKHLQMSGNKQFLSLLLADGSVRIWDFQRGVQRQINTQDNQSLTYIGGVNDKGELLPIASTAGISAYDVISSSTDTTLNEPNANHFASSGDGHLLLVNTGTNDLSLWDSQQNKELWQTSHQRGEVNNLVLTNDKRYGAVLSHQQGAYMISPSSELKSLTDAVDIVDLGSGKVIKSLPNLGEEIVFMQFKDNDTLQLGLANGEMLDWSIANEGAKPVGTFAEAVTAIDAAKNSYAYLLKDGTVRVGDGQGQIQFSIKNKENPFQHAMLLEEGKKLLTVMANGDLSLWDVPSNKQMLRLFSMQEGGWTVMDAFGRFDGSEKALENFSWTADKENIPLDSFSENYYEPGLLASVLQNQDYLNDSPQAIKAGISLPPKVSLQLADQQTQGDNVTLQLDVYDRGGGIDKIRVYHNGKILSNENVVLTPQTAQEPDTEHRALIVNVTPSAGKNTLKVIANNDMGIENSSAELNFDGKTKAYTSAIKLLTVGINQYKDNRLNLAYSVADADAIGDILKSRAKITTSKSLYDKNATKSKILAELKEISQGAQQDVLVIYLAGHGIVADKADKEGKKDTEWYFLPYETILQSSREKIAESGITATELSDIFKSSKIQHILLMVDSCYSGAGMDAFSKLENGQRYFSRQLSRSLGITVITAAARDQGAAELKSLGHGLFTYLMTQELQKKDNTEPVTAHSIAKQITKALPAFSKQVAGYVQEPAAYTHGNDFILTDVVKKTSNTDSGKLPQKPPQ